MSYLSEIQRTAIGTLQVCKNSCDAFQEGVLSLGEGISRVVVYIYNPKGLAALAKVLIASIELVGLVDEASKRTFALCLKNVGYFKDLLYSTFWVGSLAELITKPGARKDIVKVLNCIGDFFEFSKFLDKNQVCAFSSAKKVASFCNALPLDDLPFGRGCWGELSVVFNPFCERPKDFFIFWSSTIDLGRGLNEARVWILDKSPEKRVNFASLAKRMSSLGKMILIPCGSGTIPLGVINVVTQTSGLVKTIVEREALRKARLNPPMPLKIGS